MEPFDAGALVATPYGDGHVLYRRMAPPSYAHVHSYSVKLLDRPLSAGVIVPASEVVALAYAKRQRAEAAEARRRALATARAAIHSARCYRASGEHDAAATCIEHARQHRRIARQCAVRWVPGRRGVQP